MERYALAVDCECLLALHKITAQLLQAKYSSLIITGPATKTALQHAAADMRCLLVIGNCLEYFEQVCCAGYACSDMCIANFVNKWRPSSIRQDAELLLAKLSAMIHLPCLPSMTSRRGFVAAPKAIVENTTTMMVIPMMLATCSLLSVKSKKWYTKATDTAPRIEPDHLKARHCYE